ncbi:MAG: hypothetical protein LAP40_20370 [Acidobacteriia bacterium]|nr:hypothetical protein [Terriglobia bacterium]
MLFPHHPISNQQRAANRANAQRSTGPRSAEGKARSAQNARKHGFTASTFAVVRLEELDEVAHLKADLISVYQPVNAQELFAIERIALCQQALLRAARLEAGLFTSALDEVLSPGGQPLLLMDPDLTAGIEVTRQQNRNYCLGEGFHRMARKSNCWSLFLRYQAQADRLYRRAIEEFERLKRLRPELPNEPIVEAQPEEKEPISPACETNPCLPQDPNGTIPAPSPPVSATLGHADPPPPTPAGATVPSAPPAAPPTTPGG